MNALDPSFEEQKKIMLRCQGLFYPCKAGAEARQPLGEQTHHQRERDAERRGERVGWLNRIFGYVYQVRLLGKRMKAWNKHVHYAVKYLLICGILAAFLATAFT